MNYQLYKLTDISDVELKELVGIEDSNLNILKEIYEEDICIRDSTVMLFNNDKDRFNLLVKHINYLILQIKGGRTIDADLIKHSYLTLNENSNFDWLNITCGYTFSGKPIKFKTYNQYKFFDLIRNNDLVFSIGPAGTGKTFLAVLIACNFYKNNDIKKIILTRPAVEAGESLGFLPGDLKEKVDPYLMPLYDALYEILGEEKVNSMIEKNAIEIIPLAYMRGRTLNDAFVILDEAQNTTKGQMLMFLTRLGKNSKMIVNGDLSQIDLNTYKGVSGLSVAKDKLINIKGIGFIEFDNKDIVRNRLVEKIIENFKV